MATEKTGVDASEEFLAEFGENASYVAEQLNRFGLAYLHIIEPRIRGYEDLESKFRALGARIERVR